jgi:hypothetical protein
MRLNTVEENNAYKGFYALKPVNKICVIVSSHNIRLY